MVKKMVNSYLIRKNLFDLQDIIRCVPPGRRNSQGLSWRTTITKRSERRNGEKNRNALVLKPSKRTTKRRIIIMDAWEGGRVREMRTAQQKHFDFSTVPEAFSRDKERALEGTPGAN